MSAVVEEIPTAASESPFPTLEERPLYVVLDEKREYQGRRYRPGVYHCWVKTKGGASPTLYDDWICSPIHVEAITFDSQGNNFGRLLRFRTTVGEWREWAMPMDLLRGSGEELRGELLSMGVELDPKEGRNNLSAYLQTQHPDRHIQCAIQVGWCGGSFVLPDVVIGPDAADVIFQSGERTHDEYTVRGTLEGWREELAALAPGNPLLLFALSCAFTGPLLSRCHTEGGGVHFFGDSSTGKTTLIEAACSVWGGENYKRSWRATANGMEGAAAMFNDCLLALDEISECDPREVGAIVYALGNGRGKQRASRSGAARSIVRWRCFVLSSGERTIPTTMEEGHRRTKAGQMVRLLDIPAARAHGAWDDLKGRPNGATLSDAIKQAAAEHFGHPGRAFLEELASDDRNLAEYLENFKATALFTTDGQGQVKRAAARFALIAMAGELATEYGLTGWPEGAACEATADCFRLWEASRTKVNDERRQILDAISNFIERHGDSRFSELDGYDQFGVRERAGYWTNETSGRLYLFNATGMREALTGFDFGRALDTLQEAGVLPAPGIDGKRAKSYRTHDGVKKLYPIDPSRLSEDSDGA